MISFTKTSTGSPGIPLRMLNRHGLIAGATGTGKTVTLQSFTELLSRNGIPVFVADVKGDLAGLAYPGQSNPRIEARFKELGINDIEYQPNPVVFWDVFADQGHAVRTTISELGPLLLSRLLDLNETQSGVLNIVFRIADDQGLLLLDLKDLRSMLREVGDNAKEFTTQYGNISTATIGAIQRALLGLEDQGGDKYFGEPGLQLEDMVRMDLSGRGIISILSAEKLFHAPKTYSTFLLWILSELFEQLPEVGDLEKPKFVLCFDEAHLLFDETSDALVDKIEQVVRLIRSKGVGVYFITQNPLDIPPKVLAQLGHKVQHALRAFSPRDQKAVKAAAQTFRENPAMDTEQVLTELSIGEALVSFLDEKGTPSIVERALIVPPRSRIGAITAEERKAITLRSPVAGKYDKAIDRVSAYEMLQARRQKPEATQETAESSPTPSPRQPSPAGTSRRQGVGEALIKSIARSIGSKLGNEIIRGVLGSIFGGRRGG